jgi:hypothetical protein
MRNKVIVAYSKVLSQHFPAKIVDSHHKCHLIYGRSFESGTWTK